MFSRSGSNGAPRLEPLEPRVLFSGSDALFADALEIDGTTSVDEVVIADFNNDNIPDLSDGLYVWLGEGDGNFGRPLKTTSPYRTSSAVSADFDGDGNLDMAVTQTHLSGGPTPSLTLMRGLGDGTFVASQPFSDTDLFEPPPYRSPRTLLSGDFNGDGSPDLLVFPWWASDGVGLRLLINDGSGSFAIQSVEVGLDDVHGYLGPDEVSAADVNEDGIDDVLFGAGNDGILVALGSRDLPSMLTDMATYAPEFREVSVGDINGDGHLDFVSRTNKDVPPPEDVEIAVSLGRGDGSFRAPIITQLPFPDVRSEFTINAESDLNGDGMNDVVLMGDQWMYTLIASGHGAFEDSTAQITNVSFAEQAITTDIDLDGDIDVVSFGLLVNSASAVSVFLNQSNEAVAEPTPPPVIGFDKLKPGVSEAGRKAKFRVVREGDRGREVKVKLAFGGDAKYRKDYTIKVSGGGSMKGKRLVIPAGKKAVRVKVIPVDDRRREGTESFEITIVRTAAISLPGPTTSLETVFGSDILDDDLFRAR